MELGSAVCWFILVKYLSNANVLVIAHIMFNISLLGVGSPYMGHHFQVQVTCHLQGRSLRGLVTERSFVIIFLLYYMYIKPWAYFV